MTDALRDGAETWAALPACPTEDERWLLVEDGFVLAREHEVESVCAVGNGCLGIRGSVAEGTSLSGPATFVAGVFDIEPTWNSIPGLMVLADWTDLRVIVDGRPLTLESGETLSHRRLLDMKQGILWREWLHRDAVGRVTRLNFLRYASLADREVAVQCATVVAENYTAQISLESRVGIPLARIKRWEGVPGRPSPFAKLLRAPDDSTPVAVFEQSTTTGKRVTFAAATSVKAEDGVAVSTTREAEGGACVERWVWDAHVGQPLRLDRTLAVDREPHSESAPGSNPAQLVTEHAARVMYGVDEATREHIAAWSQRWSRADVQVDGDDEAQRALRFAIYHLVSAANPDDPRSSVGARGLTGEAYRGHVFWDTEIYVLPFYMFTDQRTARSLLEYRYHTLGGARRKAHDLGYSGALYAWESTDTGDETTPTSALTPNGEIVRILTGEQEHHISADVAFAVWQYWQASGDDDFFVRYGAEIVLDTAKFWASRGSLEHDGCYHIRRVIGPDEYHETIDDNAFTNVMARWNMRRGVATAALMREKWPERWRELSSQLQIDDDEIKRWHEYAAAIKTGFDRRSHLFEQFQGYNDLEDIALSAFEPRSAPIDIILQRERLQKSKIVKQADVVALCALLWDDLPKPVQEANFRFYEPRTAHGSSLSPALHAMVAARLSDDMLFDRLFRQAAEIDLANNMGNAAGGVHIAALGGLWQAAVLGAAGIRVTADEVVLDPHVPRTWAALRFSIEWRKRSMAFAFDRLQRTIEVSVDGKEGVPVRLANAQAPTDMAPGTVWRTCMRSNNEWQPWEAVQK